MKPLFTLLIVSLYLLTFANSCRKKSIGVPVVSTTEVADITANSAQVVGDMAGDGGSQVTLVGICYATHNNPTLSDNVLPCNGGLNEGTFGQSLINLTANTTYYVRAYGTNRYGTGYGSVTIFTTP